MNCDEFSIVDSFNNKIGIKIIKFYVIELNLKINVECSSFIIDNR
jgi:hypothetical protein